MPSNTQVRYATDPMLRYIFSLRESKDLTVEEMALVDQALDVSPLDFSTASSLIDMMKAKEYIENSLRTLKSVILEPGVYLLPGGRIAKVQYNRAKTSMYSLLWTAFDGTRLTLSGETVKARWDYVPEVFIEIQPEHRMSLDNAKAFTLKFKQCAKCGRKLRASKSVEDGIGPICALWFQGF